MNNPSQTLKSLLLGVTAIIVAHADAMAAGATALDAGTPVVVNSVPNASVGSPNFGTTGEAGYEFFVPYNETTGSRSDVAVLPSFISNVDYDLTSYNAASNASFTTLEYSGSYSQLSIGGVEYGTGELYYNVGSQDAISDAPLVKITLGSGVPGAFDLGLLQQDSEVTALSVGLYSSTGDLIGTLAPATGGPYTSTGGVNNFFYTEVNGASAGDYLEVFGSGHYQVTLGGIVFDVPEPSTYAFMFIGLGALILVARFRRNGIGA